jgi:hypothetical protein
MGGLSRTSQIVVSWCVRIIKICVVGDGVEGFDVAQH